MSEREAVLRDVAKAVIQYDLDQVDIEVEVTKVFQEREEEARRREKCPERGTLVMLVPTGKAWGRYDFAYVGIADGEGGAYGSVDDYLLYSDSVARAWIYSSHVPSSLNSYSYTQFAANRPGRTGCVDLGLAPFAGPADNKKEASEVKETISD